MKRQDTVIDCVRTLIEDGKLSCYSTPSGKSYVDVKTEGRPLKQYGLDDKELTMAIKELLDSEGKTFPYSCYGELSNELEYMAYKNRLEYDLYKRCAYVKKKYLYDLDAENGRIISIKNGEIYEGDTPGKVFSRTKTFKSQVYPDWETDSSELPFLLGKHMNLDEEYLLLISIYLVCAFLGCKINVPILVLTGEKGSAKTTILRMLEKLLDPKVTDLGGAPRSVSDFEISLNNNYFYVLDNLSDKSISRRLSDVLCRSVTGGTATRRKLYSNAEETVLNLKCIVAINGVTPVIHESDLADRILMIKTQRLDETVIVTDEELEESFKADIPSILGCVFQLIAEVLVDDEPIKVQRKTRLAAFFTYAVKVGRALGYADDVVAELLWKNQRLVNEQSLSENPVAVCVMELMRDREEFQSSVSELLGELKVIAEKNHIHLSLLPSQPNVLSRRLNTIKSNLQNKNIYYNIRNIGSFRQIKIYKKKRNKKGKRK